MVFEGLQVAFANGKGIKQPSKMIPNFIPKLITNRCRIDARKSAAIMMEKDTKMHPKGEPKSITSVKIHADKLC